MNAMSPWRLTPLCLALGVALAPCLAAAATAATALRPVAAPRDAARAALADPADERYDRAVVDGRLAQTYEALTAQIAAASPPRQAELLLLLARMKWREGALVDADAAVDRAIAAAALPQAWLFKAELLDAQGQPRQALAWFQKARDAASDPALRERLGLRIAVMQASGGDPAALERFAAKAPEAARWRAALVLGLLGHPARALAVAEASAPRERGFEAELRLADWALAANDADRAVRHAWLAVERAGGGIDRRYALATWVEAHRIAHRLDAAADALARRPASPDFTQARVDLLLELERPDEARALVERSADPALRQRLLTMLLAAGRGDEVEREYRRLIAEQPTQIRWVEGLAERHLARGDEAGALRVYEQFLDRQRTRPELVIAAVRGMIARGLADPAVAMLRRLPANPALEQATRGLLFERYLDQGEEARALALLEARRAELAPSSPELADVAEGYERLGRRPQALATLQAWQAAGGHPDDDQQAHIAELLSVTGQEAQALAQWRELWAKARLPARKDFLERKIIASAKQLGLMKSLGDELQRRQAQGTASPDEINLLLNLRIASFDGPGVTLAAQTYAQRANLGEQARLEQLARVYARMRDAPALVATLRGLARVDRPGAPDYLRQALQTLLQQRDARQQGALSPEMVAIIHELQASSGLSSAENSRYLAGIYSAAGMSEPALALYRRALAQAPADGDNLLQLTDALKRDGQALAASGLLQQAALRSRTPGDFATAISGLLDVFAADPDRRDDGGGSVALRATRLSWALRQVLLKVALDGDDVRLNSLVADIAQSQENAALQLRAYEAALPIAQDQRPAVLRQLIALSSGQKGQPGVLPRPADLARKVGYGRRLIALRQDFAASVYVDLAKAMLATGDPAGAERAFAMIDDGAGLTNVDALRAGAYAEVGRIDDAVASYRLALLRDPDDAATLVAASILQERQGQSAVAWQRYWQGLLGLVGRQPLTRDGLSESAALDATQYLPTLLEGVLLNWPRDEQSGAAALTQWRRLFEQTLATLDTARPLADQVRLQTLVRINRRLAEHVAPQAGLQALEETLAGRLPADAAFAADRLGEAHRIGARLPGEAPVSSVESAGKDWPLVALSLQAQDQAQSNLSLVLALMRHDDEAVEKIATRALAAESQGRQARHANQIEPAGAVGAWIGAVRSALGRLPSDRLDRWLVRPLEASPYRDEVLFDLYRGDLSGFNALEQAVGRPLLKGEPLMTLLETRSGDPLPEAAIRRGVAPEANGLGASLARFSIDERLALLGRLVDAMAQGGAGSGILDGLLRNLLDQPLDETRASQLLAIAARMTGITTTGEELGVVSAPAANVRRLLLLDLPAARQPLLLAMARRFADQAPEAEQLPVFLAAWYAGDDASAYRALLGLQDALRDLPGGGALQLPQVFARLETERRQDVEAFLALPRPDAAQAARFYRHHVLMDGGGPLPGPTELVRRYRALLRAVPDSPAYLVGVLSLDLQQGDLAGFAQDLRPYVKHQPADRDAATLLVLADRTLGQAAQAQETALAAELDPDDVDALVGLWDVGRATRQAGGFGALRGLFPAVFDAYLRSPAMPPAVLAALPDRLKPGMGGDAGEEPTEEAGPWQTLLAVPADSAELPGRLRQRWRESLGVGEAGQGARAQLLAALPATHAMPAEPPQAAQVRALFLRRAELGQELEGYLLALPAASRQAQTQLYALLAQGLTLQGRAPARRAALLEALSADRLDGHALQLLGELLDVGRQALSAPDAARLEDRLRRQPAMAPAERLLFARVLARSGREAVAESLLSVTVLQLLYPGAEDGLSMGPPVTLEQVNAALALWPDAARAAAAHGRLRALVMDSRARDATGGHHPEPFPAAPPPVPASPPRD